MVGHYQAIDVEVPSPITTEITPLISENDQKGILHLKYFFLKNHLFIIMLVTTWSKVTKSQLFSLMPTLLLGATIWFGVTPTEDLTVTAIHLLAVFSRYTSESWVKK